MKVIHLEAGRHLYGGARQAGYLAEALAARGIDNVVVLKQGHPLGELLNSSNGHLEVIEWPLIWGDLDFTIVRRLWRLFSDHHPDILHVHSRRGADTFGGRAAKALGKPSVLTRRVQSREPGNWIRLTCRPYSKVVAISSAVQDELLTAGLEPDKLELVPSAVNTSLFRPDDGARACLLERFDLPDDAFIAGAAAQFIPRKGQASLLPLASRVVCEHPEFRLLLFGQGRQRAKLERRVRALGLTAIVRFCGFVDDWHALLPGLDLLLHPARREGLGAVVLEAMSAGVPVVASNVGGITDVIEDGIDGRLLNPDDPACWQEAVLQFLGDRTERAGLAKNARRTIESRFTIERMTDAYLALYRDLLADGRS